MSQTPSALRDEAVATITNFTEAAQRKTRRMKHIRLFTRLVFIGIVLTRLAFIGIVDLTSPPAGIAISLIVVALVSVRKLW